MAKRHVSIESSESQHLAFQIEPVRLPEALNYQRASSRIWPSEISIETDERTPAR